MNKNQINIYRFTLPDSIGQGLTGLTPTVTIAKDSATTFSATTNSASEVNSTDAPGLYEIQFTTSECNCDLLTIRVTLATGQAPAILDVVEMQGASGATPAEIWGYNGGRTVDNTIPTVNDIWGRQAGDTTSRTITNTIPSASDNASAVWSAQTKEVTINSTQAETFATASALSSVASNVSDVKAKTDNLPESPAATGDAMTLTSETIASVKYGLATIEATNALAGGLDTLATYGDVHWSTANVSGLSTFNASTDTVTINSEQAASMTTADVSSLATSEDVSAALTSLTTLINLLLSGLYHWQVNDTIMTVYNASDVAIGAYTLTKDTTGNITAVTPIVQQQDTNNEG